MKDTIGKFYKAFGKADFEGMLEWYHKDIIFEDPAFGILKAQRAGNLWRMLCESQKERIVK